MKLKSLSNIGRSDSVNVLNLIIAIAMIVTPAIFLIYWGKSGYDFDERKDEE
ncbi:hypothetical protein HFA01_06110 [Halobacillus faecis]|uniref:Uncharacterized protein n=1 Tax=Halobacillus faecis TaxID=360184 RepID=A0A511WMJ1_9BACI|nr:hypothetical protein HFA01_06110 [Halobacillus faecis]